MKQIAEWHTKREDNLEDMPFSLVSREEDKTSEKSLVFVSVFDSDDCTAFRRMKGTSVESLEAVREVICYQVKQLLFTGSDRNSIVSSKVLYFVSVCVLS